MPTARSTRTADVQGKARETKRVPPEKIPVYSYCRWHLSVGTVGPEGEERVICYGCYLTLSATPRHWPKRRRKKRVRGADGRLRPPPRKTDYETRCPLCGYGADVFSEPGMEHACVNTQISLEQVGRRRRDPDAVRTA